MAMKDRPKAFQFAILILFSLAVTIIVISALEHVMAANNSASAFKKESEANYAKFVSAPAGTFFSSVVTPQ